METITEVTALDGFTVRVGQEVHFWGEGTHGYGKVREIRGDRVLIDPNEARCEIDSGRWNLAPDYAAKAGHPDFWAPRDHGVSLGCIERVKGEWCEPYIAA